MIRTKSEERPAWISDVLPEGQTFISTGGTYEVFAISVFKGRVYLQIIADLKRPDWYPAWFFEVCDLSLPPDWICSLPGGDLQLVLGPDFVARDEASYNRMVELDSESVTAFWRRLDANSVIAE